MLDLTHDKICKAVDDYSTLLYRIVLCHARNKEDAEDIVQEVFLSLVKKPAIRDEAHLKLWLIKVAVNKCKNLLKSAARRKNAVLDESIATACNFDSGNIKVLEYLDTLKPTDKNIIFLHYFEGYSTKEISEIIGKKEIAVRVKLTRARQKLKLFLEKETI